MHETASAGKTIMQDNKKPEMAWRMNECLQSLLKKEWTESKLNYQDRNNKKETFPCTSSNSSACWPWNIVDAVRVHGFTEKKAS